MNTNPCIDRLFVRLILVASLFLCCFLFCPHSANGQTGSISGVVFEDLNLNGTQDGPELGLDNWTVKLIKMPDTMTVSTVNTGTGLGGAYTFTGLGPGTYAVYEVLQAGYHRTVPTAISYSISCDGSASYPGKDFGNVLSNTLGSITGMIFNDLSDDGVKDAGEPGLVGWTVTVTAGPSMTSAFQVTGPGGWYSFGYLLPGSYTLGISAPSNWVQTLTPNPITVTMNTVTSDQNFGYFYTLGNISGNVYVDFSGTLTHGRSLYNWAVEMRSGSPSGTVLATAYTDASGNYAFTDLSDGEYFLDEVIPDGWAETPMTPSYYDITVGTQKAFLGKNFANWGTGSIGGKKFNDALGTCDAGQAGISGWSIGMLSSPLYDTLKVTTDPYGMYLFEHLPPATYTIREAGSSSYTQSCPSGGFYEVTLAPPPSGTMDAAGKDFGNQYLPGRIAGKKHIKFQNPPLPDSFYVPAVGWEIDLLPASGPPIPPAYTDVNGAYSFDNIPDGIYTVSEASVPGYEQIFPVNPADYQNVVIDLTHRQYADKNFVNRGTQSITGIKTSDGATGLINWMMTLTTPTFPLITLGAMTDVDGKYAFDHLPPGDYTVTETQKPPNWTAYDPVSGVRTVTLHAGDPPQAEDFINHPNGTVHDLSVSVVGGHARAGRVKIIVIRYENKGTVPEQAEVTLTLPATDVTYTPLDAAPHEDNIIGNQLVWNTALGTVAPGFVGYISVPVTVSISAVLGDVLSSSVDIVPLLSTDCCVSDNHDADDETVIASYDPNEKIVTPVGAGPYHLIQSTDTLTYQIEFQNTGNDTAFDIRVRDTLDAGLDPATFVSEGSSHPYIVSIDGSGRVEWTFANILLPDKTTDEAKSQGFFKFRVQPFASVAPGTDITNRAGIYFDFNPVVMTNTVTNRIGVIKTNVTSRWNMVSFPMISENDSVHAIFPAADPSAYAFTAATGYQTTKILEHGKGYWLKFPGAQLVQLAGEPIVLDSVSVEPGWNMIGSVAETVATTMVTSRPGGMITSQFFGYDRAYVPAASIYPGKGYWVKVREAGTLFIAAPELMSSSTRIRIIPTPDLPPPAPDATAVPGAIPTTFSLGQNYPNPFNPMTIFKYSLPVDAHVRLTIFNLLGQEVATLADGVQAAGFKSVTWNANGYPSGVYFYRLEAASVSDPGKTFRKELKMTLLK